MHPNPRRAIILLAGGNKQTQDRDIKTALALIARETGLGRENLYQALSSDGNPEFATVLKVLNALGLRLQTRPIADNHAPASESIIS